MRVLITTNMGDIGVNLFPKIAPYACCRFIELIVNKKYVGTQFHRVIKGFMIQGGEAKESYNIFNDEIKSEQSFDRKYLLAYANSGPNTNNAQFFIATSVCSWLNGKYTIFGEVLLGQEVVDKIEDTTVDGNNKPLVDQVILDTIVVGD